MLIRKCFFSFFTGVAMGEDVGLPSALRKKSLLPLKVLQLTKHSVGTLYNSNHDLF